MKKPRRKYQEATGIPYIYRVVCSGKFVIYEAYGRVRTKIGETDTLEEAIAFRKERDERDREAYEKEEIERATEVFRGWRSVGDA